MNSNGILEKGAIKMEEFIELKNVKNTTTESETHIPSTIQADTLFTFTDRLDYLINYIRSSALFPRYCVENIDYLRIDGTRKIAIPMKCFCDITLHRLGAHLDWYGYYGLAFSKEWGMKKGIQPVQYINPKSYLCESFSESFNSALKVDSENETEAQSKMKDFLLDQIMLYKPYEGMMENRRTHKSEMKCFTDECEWRFVADMSCKDYSQVYYDNGILTNNLVDISNSIELDPDLHLKFDYNDLKYVIIKNDDDFGRLIDVVRQLKLSSNTENRLISKIVVWDICKGDF